MEQNRVGSILKKDLKILNSLSSKVVFVCLFIMAFYVGCDIAIRTFTGSSLQGTVEINEYLLIIVGFLGMVHTNNQRGQITVDLLYKNLSSLQRYCLDQINNIILLLFSALFLYAAFQKAILAYETGENNWFGNHILPVWFFRWVIPISFAILALQLIANMYQLKKGRS
ncbi:MAG: TRAP transporter small permease [Deltaproteobacteria bacterium]|nr:TRAP transporter small permease [Deltaproteobacteria bacterium]